MNTDLLSANVSLAFMVVTGAAVLALLIQMFVRARFLDATEALVAAGLFYLFGIGAFGWSLIPREALFALYALVFATLAAFAIRRRARREDIRSPLGAILMQQAAMAYLFAPLGVWKPLISALLLIYFLVDMVRRLMGGEPAVAARDAAGNTDHRPPLFPAKRVRGVREFALAGAAAAFAYVFAMGTSRAPVPPPPAEQAREEPSASDATATHEAPATPETGETRAEGGVEPPKEQPASEAPSAAPQPGSPAAAPAESYTAAKGETLKSIARKLYGKTEKWREIATANPGLKPAAKLKAGQVIKLPAPPTR